MARTIGLRPAAERELFDDFMSIASGTGSRQKRSQKLGVKTFRENFHGSAFWGYCVITLFCGVDSPAIKCMAEERLFLRNYSSTGQYSV